MSKKVLYIGWAALFILCAGLGFLPSPKGFAFGVLVFFSLLFFVPPAILLYRAMKAEDKRELRRIRNLSLISLSATLVVFILNIFSVGASAAAGKALYWLLILVSSPMVCARIWVISLFLWACLLMAALQALRKK